MYCVIPGPPVLYSTTIYIAPQLQISCKLQCGLKLASNVVSCSREGFLAPYLLCWLSRLPKNFEQQSIHHQVLFNPLYPLHVYIVFNNLQFHPSNLLIQYYQQCDSGWADLRLCEPLFQLLSYFFTRFVRFRVCDLQPMILTFCRNRTPRNQ